MFPFGFKSFGDGSICGLCGIGFAQPTCDKLGKQLSQGRLFSRGINLVQIPDPLGKFALGNFPVRGLKAMLFALASDFFYSIIRLVQRMTVETRKL